MAKEFPEEKGLGMMIAEVIGASGLHISERKWRNQRRSAKME